MANRNFFRAGEDRPHQSKRQQRKGYQDPKKIEDHWDIFSQNVYVETSRRNIPAWLLPLIVLLLLILLIFWAAPTVITRIQAFLHIGVYENEEPASLLYGDDTWTVSKPVANVYIADDLKAGRLTQALYNEPVLILATDLAPGFVQVRLSDGSQGFMRSSDLMNSRASIEPDLFSYKLVIAETTKRIMSHASQGTLLAEVPMGTVLYADYRGNGISRVVLPGGQTGWIGDDGVIVLEPTGQIQPVADGARYFCSTALAFNQITVLPNGQSVYGISTAGIARLAGLINGITLPRLLPDLAASGKSADLRVNEETGLIEAESIKAGDLVFLGDLTGNSEQAADMGVCVADGQILYAGPGQTSIRLVDLSVNPDLLKRILFVRRLY